MELFAADGHDAGGCERVTGKSGMRPRDIVASGEDQYVNNRFLESGGGGLLRGLGAFIPRGFAGPGGQGIPAAVVAPSVLF